MRGAQHVMMNVLSAVKETSVQKRATKLKMYHFVEIANLEQDVFLEVELEYIKQSCIGAEGSCGRKEKENSNL